MVRNRMTRRLVGHIDRGFNPDLMRRFVAELDRVGGHLLLADRALLAEYARELRRINKPKEIAR